jgi:hypothetical protein
MNKWVELLVGLILIVLAVVVVFQFPSWREAAIKVLKGTIVFAVFLIGLLFVVLGISDLKE